MKGTTIVLDPVKLAEEKIETLQGEANAATQTLHHATEERDKAVHEVTTLHREKDKLIDEMAEAQKETDRIKTALVHHRKNVEDSLTKRENEANLVINEASKIQATLKNSVRRLNQMRSQMNAIKNTAASELLDALQSMGALIDKATKAFELLPDGEDVTLEDIDSGK